MKRSILVWLVLPVLIMFFVTKSFAVLFTNYYSLSTVGTSTFCEAKVANDGSIFAVTYHSSIGKIFLSQLGHKKR